METRRRTLSALWATQPARPVSGAPMDHTQLVVERMAAVLALGPFYYYQIRLSDLRLLHETDRILSIHGLRQVPDFLQEMIVLIHPDDLDFVIRAEQSILEKLQAASFEEQLKQKSGYCFRMRVSEGNYHVFHHQAIYLAQDEMGHLSSALHIHTDMQHIMHTSNQTIMMKGIGSSAGFKQVNLSVEAVDLSAQAIDISLHLLTQREKEVLNLLAAGLSSEEISEKLFVSKQTVFAHRKNLLRKTSASNTAHLIKRWLTLNLKS